MLATIARPSIKADVTWSPVDPRWYQEIGGMRSDAGPVVVPEAALGVATVFRAVNVLAHSVASVPLVVYRRTDDEGKERAREHPAYGLLHDQPNAWMTSFRWRHLLMVNAVLWGAHYSEIVPGPGGIGGLKPLAPDLTRVVDQLSDGRLVYLTRDKGPRGLGPERRLLQDDVFHVRGFSLDGKDGIPLTKLARNAIGLALSAERHGSMFMRKGARLSGFLSTDAAMKKEVREENEKAWNRRYGGSSFSGGTALLTGGMKYNPISSTNKDSQWLEARNFQVEELLRFLGVPGVLVGHPDKTATYASAEQFFLSFVTHSVSPWTKNISDELNSTVITGGTSYFTDFILEGLLRGDIKTRYDAHKLAIEAGFKSRNEVRLEENYNRGPDELDEFLHPMNMQAAGDPSPGSDDDEEEEEQREPTPADAEARARLAAVTVRSIERLVRREFTAIVGSDDRKGAAVRYADNPEGWADWLDRFYAKHAELIVEDLAADPSVAEAYCAEQVQRFTSLTDLSIQAEDECVETLTRLTYPEVLP